MDGETEVASKVSGEERTDCSHTNNLFKTLNTVWTKQTDRQFMFALVFLYPQCVLTERVFYVLLNKKITLATFVRDIRDCFIISRIYMS
jgi:hypothetical protein